MLNNITLQGRFVRDPELRQTQGGISVVSFTLAVDRDRAQQDGTKRTDFIDCTAWRGTADFISNHFHKGSAAIVSGRLQMNDWTDKEGNKRKSAAVLVENIYFGESKKAVSPASAETYADDAETGFAEIADDGELPF